MYWDVFHALAVRVVCVLSYFTQAYSRHSFYFQIYITKKHVLTDSCLGTPLPAPESKTLSVSIWLCSTASLLSLAQPLWAWPHRTSYLPLLTDMSCWLIYLFVFIFTYIFVIVLYRQVLSYYYICYPFYFSC